MNISEELKLLEEEMAFEFTQSQWEDALISGWRKDLSMGGVLALASGLSRQLASMDWQRLVDRAERLKPSVTQFTAMRQPCRPWIAKNARLANDALWDGNYEKAKALLKKGGVIKGGIHQTRREEKLATKKEQAGVMVIKVRERDTRHSWGVVK